MFFMQKLKSMQGRLIKTTDQVLVHNPHPQPLPQPGFGEGLVWSLAPQLLEQRNILFFLPWNLSSMSSLGIASSNVVFGLRTINEKYVFLRKITVLPSDIQGINL